MNEEKKEDLKLIVLKTSFGYLTPYGFTNDINSRDIITIVSKELGGKFTSKKKRIKKFEELLEVNIYIDESDCELHIYDTSKNKLPKWH